MSQPESAGSAGLPAGGARERVGIRRQGCRRSQRTLYYIETLTDTNIPPIEYYRARLTP
jgi:hypothetical protein